MKNKVLAGIMIYFCLLVVLSIFVDSEEGASTFCGTEFSCADNDWYCRHINRIIYSTDDMLYTYMGYCSLKSLPIFFMYFAKPVFIISHFFYALQFGFNYLSSRIMNSFFSACVLILTYLLSKRFIKDELLSVLPVLLVGLHPLYILLSVSGFTEIMFMFAVLLGLNLWYQKNYSLSTIVISLTPLIRPEGFALLIWWGILNFRKGWKNILLLGIPVGLYFLGDFILFGDFFYYVKYPFISMIGEWSNPTILNLIKELSNYVKVWGIPFSILFFLGFLKNLNKKHITLVGCMLTIFLAQATGFITGSFRFFDRYAILILPFVVLYSCMFIKNLNIYFKNKIKLVLVGLIVLYVLVNLYTVKTNQNCDYYSFVFSNSEVINKFIDRVEKLDSEYGDVYIHASNLLGEWFNFGDVPFVDTECNLVDKNLVLCYGSKIESEKIGLYNCFLLKNASIRHIEEPKIFQKSDCNEEFCIDGENDVLIPDLTTLKLWFNKTTSKRSYYIDNLAQ